MKRKRISELKDGFVESNECVKQWLEARRRKSKATAEQYHHLLYHYWLWLRDNKGFMDMQAVLDDFKAKKRQEREYEHNDMAKSYLLNDEMKLKSKAHREQSLSAIRSFYEFNRCALAKEKIDLTVREFDRQRIRERLSLKPMTLRDLETLVSVMKAREQAMMLIMVQSGMGVGEFTTQFNICTCRKEWLVDNSHVCEPVKVMNQLREGRFPIKIEIVGRKNNPEPYHTFIGRDGIEALKRYLNYREGLIRNTQGRMKELEEKERAGKLLGWEVRALQNYREGLTKLTPEWREGEPIFISNFLNPIQEANIQVAVRTAKKQTGLTDREFKPHTCRDIFKTTCAHCGVNDTISEFFIGHKLDQMGYNRLHEMFPQDIESEYLKAEPTLNILSHTGMEVDKEEVERIKQENVDLRERLDMLTSVVKRLVSELDKKEGVSFDEHMKMLMMEKSKEEALEGLRERKGKTGLRLPRD